MKKKGLILLVCLALVSTLAVNGTFAQSLQNAVDTVIEYFKNVAEISAPAPTTGTGLKVDIVSKDNGILAPSNFSKDGFTTWPDNPTGAVTQTVCAQNAATEAAYVRICIAVRTDMDVLQHRIFSVSDEDFAYNSLTYTVGDKAYTVYNFDYEKELTASASTSKINVQLLLTKETTNADVEALEDDFLLIKSFAIEADVFKKTENGAEKQMSATEALTEALGSRDNFNPFE